MVQAATGAGKTLFATKIIEMALAKGKRVAFVVPFLSLIGQTVRVLRAQGIDAVGVMQGIHELTDATQPVQVCSIQTLSRRALPKVDLVIVDEAHVMYQFLRTWMAMPEWSRVPFVGLSATPWAKGLGKHYDDLIVMATAAELIEAKRLSPYRVFAPSHPDLSKVRTTAGDYNEGDLSEVMSQPTLVGDVVSTWLRQAEERPTLVFAVDRAHARRLADEFEAAGVPSEYVDANTPIEERDAIGERLADGRIKVVVNIGTLTTGVDWDVRCIVLARPTKSEMLFVQIIGRGLRLADGKTDCLVLDHSDTTLRLGFPSEIHYDRLDDGKPKTSTQAKREKSTPLPKECPSCTRLKPAGVRECPSCGFAPEKQSGIECFDGDLVPLKGSKEKKRREPTPHSPQEVYGMLLWHANERGYKPGYAIAKFVDRYGSYPDKMGVKRQPMEPDAAFLGWIRSMQIRYAKGMEKKRREDPTLAL